MKYKFYCSNYHHLDSENIHPCNYIMVAIYIIIYRQSNYSKTYIPYNLTYKLHNILRLHYPLKILPHYNRINHFST